jgi:hypothetical protein
MTFQLMVHNDGKCTSGTTGGLKPARPNLFVQAFVSPKTRALESSAHACTRETDNLRKCFGVKH